MFVVVAEFEVAEADAEGFAELLEVQAKASLEAEPGCQVFDVCQNPEAPGTFLLYEVYDDRAAFDAHLETPHFLRFDPRAAAVTLSKTVRFFNRIVG